MNKQLDQPTAEALYNKYMSINAWQLCVKNKITDYKEMTRLMTLVYEAGERAGKGLEHKLIWDLLEAACCHPIDGDKLKAETSPKEKNG